MMDTFNNRLVRLMIDQVDIYKEENINGYLYDEILSALYSTGSLDVGIAISLEDRDKLDNHGDYIRQKRCFKVNLPSKAGSGGGIDSIYYINIG